MKISATTPVLSICLLLLAGCATTQQFQGKRMRWAHYLKPDTKEHQVVKTKHLIFSYDYFVDTKAGTITLDGVMTCNKENIEDWQQADIEVRTFFIDRFQIIVDAKRWNISSSYEGSTLCDPKKFHKTFAWEPAYMGINFGYNASVWE